MVTIFISHASEDKNGFVRSLANALSGDFKVWYDEFELKVGDSLRRKIDEGLKKADFGVVVLSKSFFAKKWPQLELDGLFALETENHKLILPIWLGVTKEEVCQFSPILGDRLAASGDRGVEVVVEELRTSISASARTREVATTGIGRAALQSLTKKLSTKENENRRLDCHAGAGEVIKAAEQIVDAIVKEIELANQGEERKRFSVTKRQNDAITVTGPFAVLIFTVLRDIFINSGARAEFFVKISHG